MSSQSDDIMIACVPADIGKSSTLLIPVCEFAVPVDCPGGDAEVAFSGDCSAGVGSITASHSVNDPTLLGGVPRGTHPNDFLDVLTAEHNINQ